MSLVDMLKQSGFKPEKNTEGEFPPFDGVYVTQFSGCKECPANEKGGKQLLVEFKTTETLAGRESKSKFAEFKKYLALEGDKATDKKKGVPFIINALFTSGVEVSGDTDEQLIENIQGALGTTCYIRAYGFKPEDSEKAYQMFSIMKEKEAIKKAEQIKKKSGKQI